MIDEREGGPISIRIFGSLRHHLDKQGLPHTLERDLPSGGKPACDIALGLCLPPEKIEAVFRNGRVIDIHDTIFPGDRVAFLPYGTPGPYRVFLGMVGQKP